MNYPIKDKATLKKLQCDKTLKMGLRSITIEIDGPSGDVKPYEQKLNRYYFACGCTVGKIAVLVMLLLFGILWLVNKDSDMLKWWVIVISIFGSAIIGKIVGLVVSHYLLLNTYCRLEEILQ